MATLDDLTNAVNSLSTINAALVTATQVKRTEITTSRDTSVSAAATATTQAGNASASATAAAASATTAGTQASTATTQATSASASATNATTQATNAATSATAAAASATSAANSATTSSTQASNAAISATAAAGSATTATTQATNAATSATAAAASASSFGPYGLMSWALTQAFQVVSMATPRDANGAITSANIKWPDGVTGVFTTDVASTTFPGAIDAWHATYAGSPVKLITQTAVTRDANGAVIAQPAITIA